jgi:hypothetical protein
MSLRFRSLISIAVLSVVSAFQVDNAESLTLTLNNLAPQSFSTRSGRRPLRHILVLAVTFQIWIDCFQLISGCLCIQPSCGYVRRVGQQPHGTVLDVRKESERRKSKLPPFHGRDFFNMILVWVVLICLNEKIFWGLNLFSVLNISSRTFLSQRETRRTFGIAVRFHVPLGLRVWVYIRLG